MSKNVDPRLAELDELISDVRHGLKSLTIGSEEFASAAKVLSDLLTERNKMIEEMNKGSAILRSMEKIANIINPFVHLTEITTNVVLKKADLDLKRTSLADHNARYYDMLRYEETGTLTTTAGRNEMDRYSPPFK